MSFKSKEREKEYNKKWFQLNKERLNANGRRERCAIGSRKWRKNNPEKKYLSAIKSRSKRKGYEFNLTIEDIKIPDTCPILQIPIFITEGPQCDNTPAVDRIDNTRGYVKGNVRVISHKANRIKSDFSLEQAERLVAYMRGEI